MFFKNFFSVHPSQVHCLGDQDHRQAAGGPQHQAAHAGNIQKIFTGNNFPQALKLM
jgi:hypothetical protein